MLLISSDVWSLRKKTHHDDSYTYTTSQFLLCNPSVMKQSTGTALSGDLCRISWKTGGTFYADYVLVLKKYLLKVLFRVCMEESLSVSKATSQVKYRPHSASTPFPRIEVKQSSCLRGQACQCSSRQNTVSTQNVMKFLEDEKHAKVNKGTKTNVTVEVSHNTWWILTIPPAAQRLIESHQHLVTYTLQRRNPTFWYSSTISSHRIQTSLEISSCGCAALPVFLLTVGYLLTTGWYGSWIRQVSIIRLLHTETKFNGN